MLNSFNSWMKPRKEGSTGDSQGGDTFLNVEKGCLFLLTAVNLLASSVVDRMTLKPFLIMMLIAFITGAVGLLNLAENWGFWTLAFGFGAGGGLWGVISNLAFIRFFGPLHLGEVSGFNTSVTVFASAIGPALFSLALDGFGSYAGAIYLCLAFLVVLVVLAIVLDQPEG